LDQFRKIDFLLAVIALITTDLVILAINALQVAIGKEDVTNAFTSRNYRFFTQMGKNGRYPKGSICITIPKL
jgi:hypothetical protein